MRIQNCSNLVRGFFDVCRKQSKNFMQSEREVSQYFPPNPGAAWLKVSDLQFNGFSRTAWGREALKLIKIQLDFN